MVVLGNVSYKLGRAEIAAAHLAQMILDLDRQYGSALLDDWTHKVEFAKQWVSLSRN